jgi:HK97 family phage prohead protease
MLLLNQPLEIKALDDDGSFEGIAAAYGNVDSQGDRIEPGAFKSAEGEQVPLLFAHKTDQPIGFASVTETPEGLMVKGKLLLDTVAGAEAYARLKAGVLKALSVGFWLPKDGSTLKAGIRVITRAVLKEISLVVFAANELATVTAVKQDEREETPEKFQFRRLANFL